MSLRMLTAGWLGVVFVVVLGFKLVHDTDIFWQIKLGQITLEEGRIPVGDRFTYTHAGEPVPPIYWLAQILLASLYNLGGWHLARAAHQLALVGSLVVAAATCRRDRTSLFSVLIAMMTGFAVMVSNADLRPQSFGLLGFAILLALARGRAPFWCKLLVASAILVIWQNMHPSVVMGAVALGGLAVADFVDRQSVPGSAWQQAVLTLLAFVSQFATPLGTRILNVSVDNLRISREVLHIGEWLPPWHHLISPDAVRTYWIVLFCSLIAVVRLWRHVSWRDRMLFGVMTFFSLYASRFIVLWAVALVPLWAELVERTVPRDMFVFARGREDHRVYRVRSWIVVTAVLTIAMNLQRLWFGSIFRREIAENGIQPLRDELPAAARIYNNYGWAGPLILTGSPEWRSCGRWSALFFQEAGRMAGVRRRARRPDLTRRARAKTSPRRIFPSSGFGSGTD